MVVIKVVLILLAVVAVGAGGAVVVAPSVTIQNGCGHPLALPNDVPLVGRQLNEGDTTVKAPPGDYTLTSFGSALRVQGPMGIDISAEADTGSVAVTKDGKPIDLAQSSQTVSLGFGSSAVISLCTNP